MFVLTVSLTLHRAADRDALLRLLAENAARSLADEPGCRRFDVATDPERPETVFLYEVYDDEAAIEAHRRTPHFRAFQEAAAPLIAEKSRRRYDLVTPAAP